jgi:hypothetical protein
MLRRGVFRQDCVWRIATRADITGKSRRERQVPLESNTHKRRNAG